MCLNKRGFTLIELLVSISILSVVFLGLFKALYASIDYNMVNMLRAEGVTYGDEIMTQEMLKPFAAISTNTRTYTSTRAIALAFKSFSATRTNVAESTNTTSVQINVRWQYKGIPYSHSVSSMVTNPNQ
ncbi:MAG: prepilin-type N-terminal cleavage/methylation domain-containing protein [Oryzomonas sp.]|uniref:type IV pilus modification PilV family protein n=1 Tax=Oryzomonas sp. TaxID=2855186 RepID=UPI0028482632|nr:prepilin-type N-terminal cleavage/methylation domain-containing protein [Oryzomonas sp.]MDR3580928.1 prepilin-type N-terminal cleavage/methylation domain-containing protein [Oryzomonas sp.]